MTRRHHSLRRRRLSAGLFLATAFVTLQPLPARAAGILVQPEVLVSQTATTVDQPQNEIFDVLPYSSLVTQVKIHEEGLADDKWAKIHLQTGNTLSTQDFKTVQTFQFTEGSDTVPAVHLALLSIESSTPLGRFMRWQVEFENTGSNQWISFSAVAVGRN